MVSIKGTPWPADGECAGDVNIHVDIPEARGDRGVHPPDIDPPSIPRRMRLAREMFERFGLTAQCLELGTRQTTLSDVAKGLSRSLRRSLKELPGSLATETELSEPDTRSEPET